MVFKERQDILMNLTDKYVKGLMDRIGDRLYDPEPMYEPCLEHMDRGELIYLYELLKKVNDGDKE